MHRDYCVMHVYDEFLLFNSLRLPLMNLNSACRVYMESNVMSITFLQQFHNNVNMVSCYWLLSRRLFDIIFFTYY